MYIIQNIKYKNYYAKNLFGIKHFSFEKSEAMKFNNKKEVNIAMRLFKHKDNYEVLKVSK